ncbi:uncharacterized protein [Miscanthus floridulus]|uniref:uncharacterized protein n=1 Tax=Miscanthus floridulus TaxID=154761 RepID=UPI003457A5A6
MVDKPVAVPGPTAGAVGSSEAEARAIDATLESRAEKPVVLEEQTTLAKSLKGMVRHTVLPLSPLVVPPAMEENKVEEIEHEEARPQAVRILHNRGDEVVVVEEEDTTTEVRRLESTLSTTMTQIKRMEPLTEENEKLKEVVKLMEKNVQRAQHECDLTESNTRDLEYQKGILSEQLTTMSEQLQEQDVELGQLRQVIGQLQEEEKKASGQAEKLVEELKGVLSLLAFDDNSCANDVRSGGNVD